VRRIDGGGDPLCAVDAFAYEARAIDAPGELLCLISDG
jgi:hypothetical protein